MILAGVISGLCTFCGYWLGYWSKGWISARIEKSAKQTDEDLAREINDTIIELAAAHLLENREKWLVKNHTVSCQEIDFQAWIGNEVYGFNFGTMTQNIGPWNVAKDRHDPAPARSTKAAKKFLAAVQGSRTSTGLDIATAQLQAMVSKIGAVQ